MAADNSPSIIFIDEIDALCPKRDDVRTIFAAEIIKQEVLPCDYMLNASSFLIVGCE